MAARNGCRRSYAYEEERQQLPIFTARKALISVIRNNACCVVIGETGSGKTTQIPQVWCLASSWLHLLSSFEARVRYTSSSFFLRSTC